MNTDVLLELKSLWRLAFGDPEEAVDCFFRTAFSPNRCLYTREDGRIVCALYWLDASCQGRSLAYLYALATHPHYRGKGHASRLIKQAHRRLKAEGYSGVVLKPAEGLIPFYERLGYAVSGFLRRFTAAPGNDPIPLTRLTAAQYGALRREYLPENGIVQEGVTLDFLACYADFFACEKALVCVMKDRSEIVEFLGDPAAAPGILAALNMEEITIYTPGDAIPFAMYHPLDSSPAPGYLGLSLE